MNTAGSVLVDTNIVVAYFRGDKVLPPRFAEVTPVYVPWVVLGELHFGAQRAQRRPLLSKLAESDLQRH
jgi:tRNA(fMet)-specific endonuclease VapC